MRADKEIYFVTEGERVYDPDTGDYIREGAVKVLAHAYVSDTSAERMGILYAGIREYAKTVRLNHVAKLPYDFIEIDGEQYQTDSFRHYRHKSVFEVSRT